MASKYVTLDQFNAFAQETNATLKLILERLDAPQASPADNRQEKKNDGIDYTKPSKTRTVEFHTHDGRVLYCSEKQLPYWEASQKGYPEYAAKREASEAGDPAVCRELEKRLGLAPNTLTKSAISAKEFYALGVSPSWTRKMLHDLKDEIRESLKK